MTGRERELIEKANEAIVNLHETLLTLIVEYAIQGKVSIEDLGDFPNNSANRLKWLAAYLNKGDDFIDRAIEMTYDENTRAVGIMFK